MCFLCFFFFCSFWGGRRGEFFVLCSSRFFIPFHFLSRNSLVRFLNYARFSFLKNLPLIYVLFVKVFISSFILGTPSLAFDFRSYYTFVAWTLHFWGPGLACS